MQQEVVSSLSLEAFKHRLKDWADSREASKLTGDTCHLSAVGAEAGDWEFENRLGYTVDSCLEKQKQQPQQQQKK